MLTPGVVSLSQSDKLADVSLVGLSVYGLFVINTSIWSPNLWLL